MKHGIIAQHITTTTAPELVYSFAGSAAFSMALVNLTSAGNVEVDIAHVPANESLSDKHWIVWKQDVLDWKPLPCKWLAKAGDSLHIRSTEIGVSIQVNGIEA